MEDTPMTAQPQLADEDAAKLFRAYDAQLEAKVSEFRLMSAKEDRAPHRRYPTVVYYDPSESRFVCRTANWFSEIDMDEDDFSVDDKSIPIAGYGASPTEACDNFDRLWTSGYKSDK